MLIKDFAICIQASDFSETSQVLTFFGRLSGKFRCIAKGSKRPKSSFGGTIEIFAYGNIVFSSSGEDKLAALTEFEQEKPFTALAKNLDALNAAQFAAELVNKSTKELDPHPRLFDFFLQFLQDLTALQDGGNSWLELLILFQLSLLNQIGLQPVFNHCINCKTKFPPHSSRERPVPTPKTFYFSCSANGLICNDCESAFVDKVRLSSKAAACLADLKLIKTSSPKTLMEIEKILILYFTSLLGKTPKLAKYVLKTSSP